MDKKQWNGAGRNHAAQHITGKQSNSNLTRTFQRQAMALIVWAPVCMVGSFAGGRNFAVGLAGFIAYPLISYAISAIRLCNKSQRSNHIDSSDPECSEVSSKLMRCIVCLRRTFNALTVTSVAVSVASIAAALLYRPGRHHRTSFSLPLLGTEFACYLLALAIYKATASKTDSQFSSRSTPAPLHLLVEYMSQLVDPNAKLIEACTSKLINSRLNSDSHDGFWEQFLDLLSPNAIERFRGVSSEQWDEFLLASIRYVSKLGPASAISCIQRIVAGSREDGYSLSVITAASECVIVLETRAHSAEQSRLLLRSAEPRSDELLRSVSATDVTR